jgi:ATP synthase protein I
VSEDPHRGPPGWATLSGVGFLLVLTTVIGFGLGYWADRRFGTEPWLTLVGVVLGAASGLIETIRLISRYDDLS